MKPRSKRFALPKVSRGAQQQQDRFASNASRQNGNHDSNSLEYCPFCIDGTLQQSSEQSSELDASLGRSFDPTWRGPRRRGDRSGATYQELNWGSMTPLTELEIRKKMLRQSGSCGESSHRTAFQVRI